MRIIVPSIFIAGRSDWGIYQKPGAYENMQSSGTSNMLATYLIDNAGHWVQQEAPEKTNQALHAFINSL